MSAEQRVPDPGMFPSITRAPDANDRGMFPTLSFQPDSQAIREMEDGADAVRFKKIVELVDVCVRQFDLSDPKAVAEYVKVYRELFIGQQAGTHVITFDQRLPIPDAANPRWIQILEWYVRKLHVTDYLKRTVSFDKEMREQALAKLTPDERRVLGLMNDVEKEPPHA